MGCFHQIQPFEAQGFMWKRKQLWGPELMDGSKENVFPTVGLMRTWTHRDCGNTHRPAQVQARWVSASRDRRGHTHTVPPPNQEAICNGDLLAKEKKVFSNGVSISHTPGQVPSNIKWIPCFIWLGWGICFILFCLGACCFIVCSYSFLVLFFYLLRQRTRNWESAEEGRV